jgi:beta-1,4-mannosyl-glycoprotein beta-1,4-N-acetylglucosaminyltransferase
MIVDCFSFFNEFDVLDIRLNELKDVVDVFVLVEATLTFSGKSKPLYYNESDTERYKDFPICSLIVDAGDPVETNDFNVATRIERRQRQMGVDAMMDRFNPDVVILSDCDEIPKVEVVKQALKDDKWNRASLSMPLYYYWMNCLYMKQSKSGKWMGKPWSRPKLVRPKGSLNWRGTRYGNWDVRYKNAGWHFSHLGDILPKIQASAHVEYNKPPFNVQANIDAKINALEDVYDRKCKYKIIEDLSFLPQYVLDNKERFSEYIYEKS